MRLVNDNYITLYHSLADLRFLISTGVDIQILVLWFSFVSFVVISCFICCNKLFHLL